MTGPAPIHWHQYTLGGWEMPGFPQYSLQLAAAVPSQEPAPGGPRWGCPALGLCHALSMSDPTTDGPFATHLPVRLSDITSDSQALPEHHCVPLYFESFRQSSFSEKIFCLKHVRKDSHKSAQQTRPCSLLRSQKPFFWRISKETAITSW